MGTQPTEVTTLRVKYVFLDIVRFSTGRSVEAQIDIVATLNATVKDAVAALKVTNDDVVYIPTGDGICIALLDQALAFDSHLRLALDILQRIDTYNQKTDSEMRRFQVRIGLNENVDNLITDINGNRNVAGSGVTIAQRVMDKGDGGRILLGSAVYDTLFNREKYMNCFREIDVVIKHGEKMKIYQFVADAHPGLVTELPAEFVPSEKNIAVQLGNKLLDKLRKS